MQSRIFRGLLQPLLTVTAIATAVATWETLREVNPRQTEVALAEEHACIFFWPQSCHFLLAASLYCNHCKHGVESAIDKIHCAMELCVWFWRPRTSFVVFLPCSCILTLVRINICAVLVQAIVKVDWRVDSHAFVASTADRLFASQCSKFEHRDKRPLQPHKFCFVASAGLQNQYLIFAMGRGPIHLGWGHEPIQRHHPTGPTPSTWLVVRP